MSTPPPYRPRDVPHDENENPPPYTESQRHSNVHQAQTPPEYQRSQPASDRPSSDFHFLQEVSHNGHPSAYILPPQPSTSANNDAPPYTQPWRQSLVHRAPILPEGQSSEPTLNQPDPDFPYLRELSSTGRPSTYVLSPQVPSTSAEDAPPYTGPRRQSHTRRAQTPPEHQSPEPTLNEPDPDFPYLRDLSSTGQPFTFALPPQVPSTSMYRECRAMLDPSAAENDAPLLNNSRKSMWRRLKAENELRKARVIHVTHEQAAALLGHDEAWERERQMGRTGADGWERNPYADDRWCVIM